MKTFLLAFALCLSFTDSIYSQTVRTNDSELNAEVAKQIAKEILREKRELKAQLDALKSQIKDLKTENLKLRALAGLSTRKEGELPSAILTDGEFKYAKFTVKEVVLEGDELFVRFVILPLKDSSMRVVATELTAVDDKGVSHRSDLVFIGKDRDKSSLDVGIVRGVELSGQFRFSGVAKESKRITLIKGQYIFNFDYHSTQNFSLRDFPIVKK